VSSKRSSASSAKNARGQHLRGTVVERQAFLERQLDRREPGALQRLGAAHPLVLVERLATAEQHDRQVRQRCQVATGADRALLRHHRHHAGVEHRRERFERAHANTRVTAHQRVDADQQHRPHHVPAERFAHANRVGDDQVVLQFLQQRAFRRVRIPSRQLVTQTVRAEQLVGIAAEAGGDAIGRLAATHFVRKEIGGALHALEPRRIQ
jgi:hypothetical protein